MGSLMAYPDDVVASETFERISSEVFGGIRFFLKLLSDLRFALELSDDGDGFAPKLLDDGNGGSMSDQKFDEKLF